VETTGLVVPTNAGEIRGAGRGLTIITGAPNVYTSTSASGRDGLGGALISMTSGSSTNVTTTFRSMSFDGRKNIAGFSSGIRTGFAVQNRHGWTLDDFEIRYFNTSALRIWQSNEFTVTDGRILESSGPQGTSYTHYQIE